MTGATVTSHTLMYGVAEAARMAQVSDIERFKTVRRHKEKTKPVEGTWDVVIVGGGGTGMAAAAEAAQRGNTVLVIEKNAEMGGNTVISGRHLPERDAVSGVGSRQPRRHNGCGL